jgi:predicted DNA-binding protein with PD1-like motif
MKLFRGASALEVMVLRLDEGGDLLDSLQQVISDAELAAGVFLAGAGTMEHVRLELPANLAFPPAVIVQERQGPAEIVSAQGHIVGGQAELYLTVAKRGEVIAGRVLPGNRALFGVEISMLRVGNSRWARLPQPGTGVPQFVATSPEPPTAPRSLMLMGRPVDPSVLGLVPQALLRKHSCLPVARSGDTLVVAMTDPNNPFAIDELRQVTGLRIQAVGVPPRDLIPVLQQLFSGGPA